MPDDRPTIDADALPVVDGLPEGVGDTSPGADSAADTIPNEDADLWTEMAEAIASDADLVSELDLEPAAQVTPPAPPAELTQSPAEPQTPPQQQQPQQQTQEPVTPQAQEPQQQQQQQTPPEPVQQQPQQVPPEAQQPTPPQEQQQSPPPPAQPTEEEIAARQQAHEEARQATRNELLSTFALSEEQQSQLLTEPGKVLPGMMADLFLHLYESVAHGLTNNMPGMIQQAQQASVAEERRVSAFYEAYPQLDRNQHHATVQQLRQLYMTQNPQADDATASRAIAAMAMFQLQIDPAAAASQGAPQQAPRQQQASTTPAFVPANPGGGSPPAQRGNSGNSWTDMAEEFLEAGVGPGSFGG